MSAANPTPLAEQLSQDEARRLTDGLKQDVKELWRGLRRAQAGNAHAALGYPSFAAYCEAEFGFSKAHTYRLVKASEVAEECPQVETEGQARELARLLKDHREDILGVFKEAKERAQGRQVTAALLGGVVDEHIASAQPLSEEQVGAAVGEMVVGAASSPLAQQLLEAAHKLADSYLDLDDGMGRFEAVADERQLAAADRAAKDLCSLVVQRVTEVRSLVNEIAKDANARRDHLQAAARAAGARLGEQHAPGKRPQ